MDDKVFLPQKEQMRGAIKADFTPFVHFDMKR